MKKIKNESGEYVPAIGDPGSHARAQFNLTFEKLMNKLMSNWCQGGPERHTHPDELNFIMEDNNVPKEWWQQLSGSANYYFTRDLVYP